MPYIDVPAHVAYASQVQSHVQMEGGTNWDLSRSAVNAPVYKLDGDSNKPTSDFTSITNGGQTNLSGHLVMLVHFPRGSSRIPRDLIGALKRLPHDYPLKVVFPDDGSPLQSTRAAMVSRTLEERGYMLTNDDVPLHVSTRASGADAIAVYLVR